MPGWLTMPRNPLSHKDTVLLHLFFSSHHTPGSILTGEVVQTVAVHQPPVPITAVCVVSHDTNLADIKLLLAGKMCKNNKPSSSSPLHPQKMFQRPHQIVHSGFGELL